MPKKERRPERFATKPSTAPTQGAPRLATLKDGRPEWFGTKRTMGPTQEALRLGALAEAFIRSRKDRTLDLEGSAEGLTQNLVQIADVYLAKRAHRLLPTADAYRTRASRIAAATECLLDEIRTDRRLSQELSIRVRGRLALNLWDDRRAVEPSLEKLLVRFAEACRDAAQVTADTAQRPRDDIENLAAALAQLWQGLSGERCAKNYTRKAAFGDASGGAEEFKSPGPRFVCEVARVIDPDITIEQVTSALRKRPSDPPVVPPSL